MKGQGVHRVIEGSRFFGLVLSDDAFWGDQTRFRGLWSSRLIVPKPETLNPEP